MSEYSCSVCGAGGATTPDVLDVPLCDDCYATYDFNKTIVRIKDRSEFSAKATVIKCFWGVKLDWSSNA